MVPSGRTWEIRETNGNDDAILSNFGSAVTGDNIYNFLANIIVGPTRPLAAEIMEWPINDKYYLLFKNRVWNFGQKFIYRHTDPLDETRKEETYEEDLAPFDGDLSDPEYTPTAFSVRRHPAGEKTHLETVIEGHKFRFQVMTGAMEKADYLIGNTDRNRNTILTSRKLEEEISGKWLLVTSFHSFSSKLMSKIRGWVSTNDEPFAPFVHFTNPRTQTPITLPLFAAPTFFFPEETT